MSNNDRYAGYFLDTEGEPRVRRARDAVQIGIGLLLFLIAASERIRLSTLQEALNSVTRVLPGWAELLFRVGYGIAGVYVLAMVVAVIWRARSHPKAARDVVLAVVGSAALAVLAARWQQGNWPDLFPEFGTGEAQSPIVRVAVVTAAVIALSPHVTRVIRRFGALVVVVTVIAGFGLLVGYPTDALGAVGARGGD